MQTMTHKQLVEAVATKLQRPSADVDKLLGALVQTIATAAGNGEDVCVPGFGNFETNVTDERVVLVDGRRYLDPSRAVMKFNISSLLSRQIRNHKPKK